MNDAFGTFTAKVKVLLSFSFTSMEMFRTLGYSFVSLSWDPII